MSTQAITQRARATVAVGADAPAVGFIAAVVVFLLVMTWRSWGDLGADTGYDLVAGARVAHGDLPYGDFTYYYGPLSPLVLGAAMTLGGATVTTAVTVGIVVGVAIVAATYALARRLTTPLGAALAATLVAALAFAPGNFSYVLPHTESAPLAILLTLLFLLALGRREGRRRGIVAAGVAAGLVALTRPEFALAVYTAAAVVIGARLRRKTAGIRDVTRFSIPALGIPALVYGMLLARISLHRLLFENLYPSRQLAAAGNHILRVQAPMTISSVAELGLKLVLYALGAALLALAGRWLGRRREVAARLAAAAGAVAGAMLVVWRPETVRFGLEYAYGWIPAGAALAACVLAVRAFASRSERNEVDELQLGVLVVLAILALKVYAGFFFFSSIAQPAVYAAPFAAVFLVALHLRGRGHAAGVAWLAFLCAAGTGLTVDNAAQASAPVVGAGGEVMTRPGDARMYQLALQWIAAGTPRGGTTLLAPQLTALYTLSQTSDPLPELSLIPGALPNAAAERAATATLAADPPQIVVTDRHPFTEYGQTSFGGSFDRVVAAWIHAHYRHAATIRGAASSSHTLDIWLRRSR